MRRKRFPNELCVYCGLRPGVTAYHVFSRSLFLPTSRDYIPKVPACERCNNDKSQLELYLSAVLPFGGSHEDAHQNLVEMVPKRLAKNVKLHRELSAGHGQLWHVDGQAIRSAMSVPIQADKVTAVARYWAIALAWHHWQVRLIKNDAAEAWLLSNSGRALFDRLFTMNGERVQHDLGRGTIHHQGIRSTVDEQLTLWRFQLYGGLQMAGDPQAPDEVAGEIGAMTGTKRLVSLMSKGV